MPMSRLSFAVVGAAFLVPTMVAAQRGPEPARLRVTQGALVVVCKDGGASRERAWTLPTQPVTLVTTMTNAPRSGIANAEPGHARITFTPEAGHRYQLEVRADAAAFSRRVFAREAWAPVVRDRTLDRVVSSAPEWTDGRCGGASGQR